MSSEASHYTALFTLLEELLAEGFNLKTHFIILYVTFGMMFCSGHLKIIFTQEMFTQMSMFPVFILPGKYTAP